MKTLKTGLNIIYSANMLNEGIHPKKLDAVVFLRKTRSSVIYQQQLGRVISEYLDNSIVFDLVNNIYNIETGYIQGFKDYAKKHNINYKDLKTNLNEPLKIYEEQKDLINLLIQNVWRLTSEEKDYIEKNRLIKDINEIAKDLNRNYSDIYRYLKRNKLKFYSSFLLSRKEKNYIKKNRLIKNVDEIAKDLNRNVITIRKYLKRNNLSYKNKSKHKPTRLTSEEKDYIEKNRLIKSVFQISRDLNRSNTSIYNYLNKNNLEYKGKRK